MVTLDYNNTLKILQRGIVSYCYAIKMLFSQSCRNAANISRLKSKYCICWSGFIKKKKKGQKVIILKWETY